MNLEVHERLVLVSLLPEQGEFAALVEYRKVREALSFSPEEKQAYNIRHENGRVMWDVNAAAGHMKDVPISEYVHNKIRTILKDMDATGTLHEEHLSLFEKFVIAYSI